MHGVGREQELILVWSIMAGAEKKHGMWRMDGNGNGDRTGQDKTGQGGVGMEAWKWKHGQGSGSGLGCGCVVWCGEWKTCTVGESERRGEKRNEGPEEGKSRARIEWNLCLTSEKTC